MRCNTRSVNSTLQSVRALNDPYGSSGTGQGAGAQEKRGREGYGRQEEKGREAGLLKWREPGEKEKNFAILRNISQ